MRILKFVPSENAIHVSTYSPWLDRSLTSPDEQFALPYDMSEPEKCSDADINGDSAVGPDDLAVMLGHWGEVDVPADLDGGGVGPSDLAILLGDWGPCE